MRTFALPVGHEEMSQQPAPSIPAASVSASAPFGAKEVEIAEVADGGLIAWLHCISAFLLFFNGWGVIGSFGVYQTFYEQTYLPHEPPSNVAWIGSLQAFLSVSLGVVAGPMYDHGFSRTMIIVGSGLLVAGLFLTSFARLYRQLMMTQGILVGLGGGLLFLPGLLALSCHFHRRIALAQGIATSGGSLGGVIYPINFSQLEPTLGFGWATRIMALIAAGTLLLPVACMMSQKRIAQRHRALDLSAWREAPYVLFALAIFFGFVGFYVPYCYVQAYSLDKGIMAKHLSFYLLPILNAGAFFGRILPNIVAAYIGPLDTLILCAASVAILVLLWIPLQTTPSVIAFCVLYGLFSSPLVSLAPNIIARLCPDPDAYGTRMGMIFVPMAFGYLIGNPIAGVVLGVGWLPLQLFCAGTLLVCGVFLVLVKLKRKGLTSTGSS